MLAIFDQTDEILFPRNTSHIGASQPSYVAAVMSIPTTAAAMTAVASQPVKRRTPVTVNWPMTFVLAVRSIISTITGTATTPLMTADQKSAWIRFNGAKFKEAQIKVAMAKVA